MTTTATTQAPAQVSNPHRIGTLITGWAIPIVFLGALYGASTTPEHAGWSAFAVLAIIACYAYNKVRSVRYNRSQSR